MLRQRLHWAVIGPRFGIPAAAALMAGALLAPIEGLKAHEGHDHGAPAATERAAAPRVALSTETYELVGVVNGDRLVIYLDRAATNAPVATAAIAVTIADAADPQNAEAQPDGTYALTSPRLRAPGEVELVFSVTGDGGDDLLAGTVRVPAAASAEAVPPWQLWRLANFPRPQQVAAAAAAAVALGCLGALLLYRRRLISGGAAGLAAAGAVALLAVLAREPEHHDHTHGRTGSTGNGRATVVDAPARLPDGSLFVPKLTQRLLEVRTAQIAPATAEKSISLIGRTIADPHGTSLVQSINGGRVGVPDGGQLPRVGQVVQKGQLLAQVEPSFPLADRTTIAERIGEIEQLIAVAESKLRRARTLAEQHIVPRGQVIDAEAELEGLRNRREVLRATRAEPELLRASTSGVITSARAVPGQVVQAQDVLFQIVDPARLWVEALAYDAIDPAALTKATATASNGQPLTLKFQGFSRALQQHASVVQFAVENPPPHLGIGLPVSVIAATGEGVTALIVPRDAVVRNSNGEAIVWRHAGPERFEPRPVRVEPVDATRVAIAAGVHKGERIVVRAANLVNQVR